MKKQTLLVLAGGLLTFAACTNDAQDGGYTQEQVDSIVDVRVTEMQTQMQMSNDSAINALAQWKADSMIAAAKGQAPSTPKPRVKGTSSGGGSTTTPTTTTPSTPANPKDDRFNGGTTNTDKKDARFDENAAQKQQDANTKKKEDRFK